LIAAGVMGDELLLSLMVEDIQMAADVLRPIYDRTQRVDGYISIEVLPSLANDTQGTIAMAHELFARVGRPNIFVKIPATPEGLPAIEACLADGLNINITLLFSVKVYEEVARAYLRALQRRLKDGKSVDVASVASFFVSRVDTAVDNLLEAKIAATPEGPERQGLGSLLGQAAVANAKLAYQAFKAIFNSPEFAELRAAGAQVQRCLWASTGTKNPHYSDVKYVEELIGPQTVNTMPEQTLRAFKEHGEVRLSLEENIDGAREVMRQLAEVGIDIDQVTKKLELDGVTLFADSITKLLQEIEKKKAALQDGQLGRYSAALGGLNATVETGLRQLEAQAVPRRLQERDASLWSSDPAAQAEIKERLGWLTVVDRMEESVPDLVRLRDELRQEGFTAVVLMGMGGSSLAPEVFRTTFGTGAGGLHVHVLDTTDPAAIAALERSLDLKRTLFIVASKSGTTTETLSHYQYFLAKTGNNASQFIAITDPGTPLAAAAEGSFRRVFLNPADIGGRYSALSYFGLVPAALGGVDVGAVLDRAQMMVHACAPSVPASENPGAWLGAILGEAAVAGRDKVTIIAAPAVAKFGLWAEQLLAESTGKQGKGLVPVADEPLGAPAVYGDDRIFVHITLAGDTDAPVRSLAALAAAGHPVVTLTMRDTLDLGPEFYRWEYATAVAGSIMGINAFDQPNVQEAKDITRQVLSQRRPATVGEGISWAGQPGASLDAAIESLLALVRPHDYVALMAYVPPADETERALTSIRVAIRDQHRVATTVGYGPRFLHSTGQLHKGGPNTGVFLQIVGDDPADLPIPGAPYTFGQLKQAQAYGDYITLRNHGRRVLRIQAHDVAEGLAMIGQAVGAPVPVE
jgi:transaldolase / glucose-6-phosphate isomerase